MPLYAGTVSKHWQPGGKVFPFRQRERVRRSWHGMDHVSNGGWRGAGRSRSRRGKRFDVAFWRLFVLVAGFSGLAAWHYTPVTLPSASGASEVRASFHFCHSGGGYNCVVDGDTIWLEGQNIRIAGIDAPETHDYRCEEEKALGNQTTQRLLALVNSGAVTLSSIARDEDRYGRKLRNVAVDGQDVGETLIAEGLAREYAGGRRSWCG